MVSPQKTTSSVTHFYIGEGGGTPVVLHCFRAGKRKKEVPLQPALVFAEACLSLVKSKQKVILVQSPVPETQFFGELPGAFVENRPAKGRVLWALLQQQRSPQASQLAWSSHAEAVLAPVTFLALWGYGPCYRKHTRRAVLQGTCLGAWPQALAYCWRQRARRGTAPRLALQRSQLGLENFLDEWEAFRSANAAASITLDELTVLSFAKCLAAIPEDLLALKPELQKRLKQLVQDLESRLEESQEPQTLFVRFPTEAEPGSAEVAPLREKLLPLASIMGFLRQLWRSDEEVQADNTSVPISAHQRRGNILFGLWLLGSSALYTGLVLSAKRAE